MEKHQKTYIIGDIHGCKKSFEKLLETISPGKDDRIYLLGDYVDRGPDSKGVVDVIFNLIKYGYNLDYLRGNHEQMLLDSIHSRDQFYNWLRNGAQSTLSSYNTHNPGGIPRKYLDFYKATKFYIELDEHILVHGGLNFEYEDPFKDKLSMLWVRNNEVDLDKTNGKKLIIGHTPVSPDRIEQSLSTNKIMLDGGCVYDDKLRGLGNLVALELNTYELTFQRNIDEYF